MRWEGNDVRALIIIAAACAVAAPAAAGDYRAPRTPWGAPDLDGQWMNRSLTFLERPDEFKTLVPTAAEAAKYEKDNRNKAPADPQDTVGGLQSEWWENDVGLAKIRGQVRTSWIVAPADGQLPFSKAAKAARKVRRERRKVDFDGPESRNLSERCLATDAIGPPLQNGGYSDLFKFVQTRDQIAIFAEYMHDVRIIRLGKVSHLPAGQRQWLGDSIGRWEGDTLVVDTTNFTPAEVSPEPVDAAADMHVIERFTRTGPDEITYSFSVEDNALFAQSWQGEMVMKTNAEQIYEYACHEGNYGLANILSGGRETEKAAAAAGATSVGKAP